MGRRGFRATTLWKHVGSTSILAGFPECLALRSSQGRLGEDACAHVRLGLSLLPPSPWAHVDVPSSQSLEAWGQGTSKTSIARAHTYAPSARGAEAAAWVRSRALEGRWPWLHERLGALVWNRATMAGGGATYALKHT